MDIAHLLSYLTTRTFRGKITLAYIALGFLILLLGTLSWVYVQRVSITRYESIINKQVPVRYYCGEINTVIGQTTTYLNNYLLTKELNYKKQRQIAWNNSYQSAVDSLMTYAISWKHTQVITLVYDVRLKASRLRAEQDLLESSTKKDMLHKSINDIELLSQDIHNTLDLIVTLQKEELMQAQANIHFKINNLEWFYTPFAIVILFALCIWVGLSIVSSLFKRLAQVEQSLTAINEGEIPPPFDETENEMYQLGYKINLISKDLKQIKDFATEVGNGNFDVNFTAFGAGGELGNTFLKMRDSLKEVSLKEQQLNWITSGIVHFSKVFRKNDSNINLLCDSFIKELVSYLDINQAGIYLLDGDKFILESFYAFEVKKYQQKEVSIKEGLLGEAFQERRTIYIENLPSDYIHITSGLGEAVPHYLLLVPLQMGNNIEGIVEIASFKPIEKYKIEFIEKVCENITSTLVSIRARSRRKVLLHEAQEQSKKLLVQEEEMRQNVEELRTTQEEMRKREDVFKQMIKDKDEEIKDARNLERARAESAMQKWLKDNQ